MRSVILLGPRGSFWGTWVPHTRRERRRGLRDPRWSEGLGPHEALLFERCRSVHTFGMRFPITVAGLDGDLRVLLVGHMRPGRLLLPRPRVRAVLECPDGADLRPGDRLVQAESAYTPPAVLRGRLR